MRLAVVALLLWTSPVTQDAAAVLQRAEDAYHRMRTLRGSFTQTIVNPMLGGPEQSRGTLYLTPPHRFAMRFTDPAGDRIVVDGTWLWAYAPSSVPDQVIKQPIPRAGASTPNLVAQFVDRPLERYTAAYVAPDTIHGVPVDIVRLIPRLDGLPFRRAEIAVGRSDGLLYRIVLVEPSGQQRTLVFDEIRTDVVIPEEEYRFEVSKGMRVVVM